MTDTRAKKAGIGADIDKKLEARYDQEEVDGTPGHIMNWINEVLAEEKPCPASDQKSLHHALRNGVVLCKLINVLLKSDGKPVLKFKAKGADSTFVAYGNIELYNKGCLDYGLTKESTVQSTDLWEGRKGPFLNVINNLHSLGMLANSKGKLKDKYGGKIEKVLTD